ncbi:MAG: hypothetical protein AAFY73_12825 [Pseudomonadota bacterium]
MADGISIDWRVEAETLKVDVSFSDPKFVGMACKLTVEMFVETLQSNGTDARKTVLTEPFKAEQLGNSFDIPLADIKGFSFFGEHIRITPELVVTIDDGVLWDTKERAMLDLPMPARNSAALSVGEPSQVLNPRDQISLARNFGTLPTTRKLLMVLLIAIFGAGALAVFAVCLHDQFSADALLFDPGSGVPPIVIGIIALVVGAVVLFFSYKAVLRGYMHVELRSDFGMISANTRMRVADLFSAVSRTPVTGLQVRLVAGALECGEYVQRSGTDTNYVAFRRPVSALVLYEKTTAAVPANVDVQQYFTEEIDFGSMFAALYPPCMYSNRHGLAVVLKLQLVVPDLADFELEIPYERIDFDAFMVPAAS